MPLSNCSNACSVVGAPKIERLSDKVRVVQTDVLAWVLVAIGIIAPVVILIPDWRQLATDMPGYVAIKLSGLSTVEIAGQLLGIILNVAILGYGLYLLLWRQELVIDLTQKRYHFTTGFGPWVQSLDGACDTPKVMEIKQRLVTSYMNEGAPGVGVVGATDDVWELSITIPEVRKPLFIGVWCSKDAALYETGAWREIFRGLVIKETLNKQP